MNFGKPPPNLIPNCTPPSVKSSFTRPNAQVIFTPVKGVPHWFNTVRHVYLNKKMYDLNANIRRFKSLPNAKPHGLKSV